MTRSDLHAELKDLLAAGADFGLLYFAANGAQEANDLALLTSDND